MKFKLDENFGTRTRRIFRDAGYDTQTVREQSLQGAPDQQLYEMCCAEQRCLVTLDLDFADVTRFPPDKTAGIAVIRVPRNPSLTLLENLMRQFLQAIGTMSITNNLWVVEVGHVRVHQTEAGEEI
jgi:predicted nuclease of predicted toxin-antitoxin system